MKLDYCYYCEAFAMTHREINWCLVFMTGFIGLLFSPKVCNHCGFKTHKRKYIKLVKNMGESEVKYTKEEWEKMRKEHVEDISKGVVRGNLKCFLWVFCIVIIMVFIYVFMFLFTG